MYLIEHIDTKGVIGIDKTFPARFLIPLQERCPELKTVWGSDCVDGVRAVKNEEEIKIMRQASVINDMVMERAAAYIKEGMTEKQIADFIEAEYYKEGATGLSFDTIVCFGANAADQHHSPSETRTLKAGECVLIDMGCIWNGYCSDMTRTFYCKSVDEEQAAIHDLVRTAVEKAEAIIKPGVRFCDIDAQARDLIGEAGYGEYWKIRLGHFIGQEDHEYGDVSPINKNVAEPGMIFSIEPGIYIEGSHGVRLENELLVCEGEKNEYGEFLYFEPITYVPFDLDAINPDIMNAEDKERLNTYHATVYEKVSPYLDDEEKEWLKKYTRAI